MLERLLEQRYYIAAIALFAVGFLTLLLHPHLVKKIIGLNLMDTAIFLFLASMGYITGGEAPIITEPGKTYIDPLPGSLVLTGIVVAVSTTALFLALTRRLYAKYGTVDLDEILILARQPTQEQEH